MIKANKDLLKYARSYVKKLIPVRAKQIYEPFEVNTLEGTFQAKAGDYLIEGIKGELYSCDKEIFETFYEDAEDSMLRKSICWECCRLSPEYAPYGDTEVPIPDSENCALGYNLKEPGNGCKDFIHRREAQVRFKLESEIRELKSEIKKLKEEIDSLK